MSTEAILRMAAATLGALAAFTILKLAEDIMVPIVLALVIGVVLSPLSDWLDKRRVPRVMAALIALALAILTIFLLGLALEPVIRNLFQRLPVILDELRVWLLGARETLRGLDEMSQEVVEAVDPEGRGQSDAGVSLPTMTDALLLAPQLAAQVLIFAGTLFFFALGRVEVYAWIARNMPIGVPEPSLTIARLRRAEREVSRYFVAITVINAVFGLAVALAMSLIGLPSPMVWGALAFGLNYILYLGPTLLAVTLLVGGIVLLPSTMALLPAIVFVALNVVEGQFATPALLGRHIRINPLGLFLTLVLMLWLWGPVGGIVAIPLLIWGLVLTRGALGQTISSGIPGRPIPTSAPGSGS